MPFFLYQATYKDQQVKALIDNPQNRETSLRQLIESFGGKLHQFFYAFGEYDAVAISEFPDNESATAAVFSLVSTGVLAKGQTTVLMTPAEAEGAMKKANATRSGYRPPGG
jgi:uncharacterized protein with GYD domain